MESLKTRWKSVPVAVRKPVVLIIGLLFVIAAGLTGWLPGPGGIPLFLIGVAILATEFEWAQRLKNWVLHIIFRISNWWKQHKVVGSVVFVLAGAIFVTLGYLAYKGIHSQL